MDGASPLQTDNVGAKNVLPIPVIAAIVVGVLSLVVLILYCFFYCRTEKKVERKGKETDQEIPSDPTADDDGEGLLDDNIYTVGVGANENNSLWQLSM